MSDSGILQESIHMLKLEVDGGHVWHLRVGRYRAYGLLPPMMGVSGGVPPCQSEYSTINMPPVFQEVKSPMEREHITVTRTPVQLVRVKQEIFISYHRFV